MITFEINGRRVAPDDIEDALAKAVMESVAAQIRERVGSIRDPETGEFPTVVVLGSSLEEMSFRVEGSAQLVAQVKQRLGIGGEKETEMSEVPPAAPRAFLSFAYEDREMARTIAEALYAGGIETWWAEWCIGPGDSLRQKIDEGLRECTHFIVLLTPASIGKPWVNQEMDAGLVLKIQSRSKFIPLRHGLPLAQLPPLLSGMMSPEIVDLETDLRQLISDIHGVTKKPRLGTPPAAAASAPRTGYSPAATAVAKVFVEASENGTFADPQIPVVELQKRTGLLKDDMVDALHELAGLAELRFGEIAHPKDELFVIFDRHFRDWDPEADALRIAADLVNDDQFNGDAYQMSQRYQWPPRRLNPAMAYLVNRDLVLAIKAMSPPWVVPFVQKTDATRRFVRSRS